MRIFLPWSLLKEHHATTDFPFQVAGWRFVVCSICLQWLSVWYVLVFVWINFCFNSCGVFGGTYCCKCISLFQFNSMWSITTVLFLTLWCEPILTIFVPIIISNMKNAFLLLYIECVKVIICLIVCRVSLPSLHHSIVSCISSRGNTCCLRNTSCNWLWSMKSKISIGFLVKNSDRATQVW